MYYTTMNNEIEKNRQILMMLYEIMKAMRCCQKEEMFCRDVTFSQFFILDAVSRNKELRLSDLHNILSVEKSTTTRLVDPLVRQELILREKSPEDSRVVVLRLTEKGEEVLSEVWVCINEFIRAVEKRIPENRREEVYRSINLFISALRDSCSPESCGC